MAHFLPMTYHVFFNRIVLRGTLSLLSGLHIGCGRAIGISGTDLPVLKDGTGQPFIPGASLKGVLRSNIEAFLRSFQTKTNGLACFCVGDKASKETESKEALAYGPCITNKQKEELITRSDADAAFWDKSCWVCRAFGSPWIASKVQIIDMPVVSKWRSELLRVRDGVAIDRESETAQTQMKFDFEVVPPGVQFGFEVLIENPEDHEMGMLILGLDMLNEGLALLGGNKSRGLGRVRIDIEEISELTPKILLDRLRGKTVENLPEPEVREPAHTQTTEEAETPGDKLEEDLMAGLKDANRLDPEGLVAAMKERGWEKSKLREKGFRNWAAFFEKSLKKGIIAQAENRWFHLPGSAQPETGKSEDQNVPRSPEEEKIAGIHAVNEQKMKEWRNALYQKIKTVTEGQKCTLSSTTRLESSID